MALDTICMGRPLRAISGSSGGMEHRSINWGAEYYQTESAVVLVPKTRVSGCVGGRGPGVAEVVGLPLDDLRQILAETGYDERPAYVPENEQRDKAVLAEFGPVRGRVNQRVLR